MRNKAINHVTVAKSSYAVLLNLANETGCTGIEVRNDLGRELFDGKDAVSAGAAALRQGLRLLAVSEVSAFNDLSERAFQDVSQLAAIAGACGAEAVSLIPRNDGKDTDKEQRKRNLRETLTKFAPVLKKNNVLGYIEPLGFEQSSLRSKTEVVEVLLELDLTDWFKLVHDTFHHHLAGGGPLFPQQTGIVHISGVVDQTIEAGSMVDNHRALVDEHDVLNNLGQLMELHSNGYCGPISVEAFSPQVQELKDPLAALLESFKYIESNLLVATE